MVELLLVNGADVNSVDRRNRTSLHNAADKNLDKIANILINHGANVNATDYGGQTVLHLAVIIGKFRLFS